MVPHISNRNLSSWKSSIPDRNHFGRRKNSFFSAALKLFVRQKRYSNRNRFHRRTRLKAICNCMNFCCLDAIGIIIIVPILRRFKSRVLRQCDDFSRIRIHHHGPTTLGSHLPHCMLDFFFSYGLNIGLHSQVNVRPVFGMSHHHSTF